MKAPMRFLFIPFVLLTATLTFAQTKTAPTITENVDTALARLGWSDKIRLGEASKNGSSITAHFVTTADKNFVLKRLEQSKDFKQSNGLTLMLFHHGAKRSFRQLSDPSLHIIWFGDKIEIHFDMHCPGLTHPLKSYRHFREVVVNWLYRSTTSQRRVSLGLINNTK